MDGSLRARGELCLGNERVRHGLGEVEEGIGALTVEAIELRWPRGGDGRGCSAFGEETEERVNWSGGGAGYSGGGVSELGEGGTGW
jgi:hypothetical protein